MRLLVYRFGQIGDTVASIPSLVALRRHFPDVHLTLLSEQPQTGGSLPPEKVLPPSGLVDEFVKYRGGVSISNLITFAGFLWSLRRRKYDVLVYLAPSTRDAKRRRRDAWFFRLVGIKRVIGMNGFPEDCFPRKEDGSLMEVEHETDALLQRLALDGISVPDRGAATLDLGITAQERAAADLWWTRNVAKAEKQHGWFALCPGSKWPSKQWPIDRYIEVARRLWVEERLLPLVLGGDEDCVVGERVLAEVGVGASAAGQLSVRESAALLENAEFYLGNDTGPMHLAAAVGTPCVAIFSAQDWKGRWHPYGPGHEVLRFEVPCAGCFSPNCVNQLECLTNIQADDVCAACQRVLFRTRAACERSSLLLHHI